MNTKLRLSIVFVGSIAMLGGADGWAEETLPVATPADPIGTEIVLPAIVINGDKVARSAERAIARKREAPNAISVIEAEQLNQFGDQPLGDALRRLPGVSFSGANRAREVQLRGIGREYTQVLLNGRALADTSSSRATQVDRIPSSMVERVEVIRAPLASQDGQGAAGTLNIVLKNENFTPRTEVGMGGGYLEENGAIGDATVLNAGEYGKFRYVFMGGVQRQRRSESADIYTYDGTGAKDGGKLGINERKYNQVNLVPAMELQLSDNDVLRVEPSYLYTKEIRFDVKTKLKSDQITVDEREEEDRFRTRENFGFKTTWQHEISNNSDMTLGFDAQSATEDTTRDAVRFDDTGCRSTPPAYPRQENDLFKSNNEV